jgi:hypothetical protein
MAKIHSFPTDKPVQVDLYTDGVFEEPAAFVKPEGSAWIDSDTLAETSFRWQDVDVRLASMVKK